MKVLGIIVEYNPFHNGHLYHLQKSKEISGADYVVAVMSSNFIQRGEPAIVNKWSRAKMALFSGVDLVLELPVVYSMSSAEFFAYGAVRILDSLGIVDCLCFGSESGRLDELDEVAEILTNEPEPYRTILRRELNKGLSFPSARENALSDYLSKKNTAYCDIDMQLLMNSSNNILAIEYLKALKKLNSAITPLTIKRTANNYNSEQITSSISSATSIRKHISSEVNENCRILQEVLPSPSLSILKEDFKLGKGPVFPQKYDRMIMSIIRSIDASKLKEYPFVSEGLENRIKQAAGSSGTFDELVEGISTRRYTRTRIQRILFSILINIKKDDFSAFNHYGGPQYVRVLGFNNKGRKILSQVNRCGCLPVIVKTANFKNQCNPLFRRMMEIESLATDIYVLGYDNPEFRNSGQEYTSNVIVL
ncbi:MAG: nucleotidyltransferase [Acetivibrionales bacterium]|jgi:predicted nucleotidyltransferase